jgi:hypothetical protein
MSIRCGLAKGFTPPLFRYCVDVQEPPGVVSQMRHHIWIRPKESFAIEVDHVVSVFDDPDLGFTSDMSDQSLRSVAVKKAI